MTKCMTVQSQITFVLAFLNAHPFDIHDQMHAHLTQLTAHLGWMYTGMHACLLDVYWHACMQAKPMETA